MIKELLGYFEKDRYQDRDEALEKALSDYELGLGMDGPEGEALRESARSRVEAQLVESGQMEEESAFINLDEFFSGGVRDRERVEEFRRDMILAHSGQQMLWSFAGTTGGMTVLSASHLESLGRSLEDLKPAGMLRAEREKRASRHRRESGKLRLYLYGDGGSSEAYDAERAKLRFDRMKDASGFAWGKAYDRNYKVEKRGWFGAFNEEGQWVRVDTEAPEAAQGIRAAQPEGEELKLVYTLDGALLYDAALLLGGREREEYYYDLEGELYGAVKSDREGTAACVREELGGRPVRGVVLPAGCDEGVKDAYRKELGDEVRFYEEGSLEVEELLEADRRERAELGAAGALLGGISRLKDAGLSDEAVRNALESEEDVVQIPYDPFKADDRTLFVPELSSEAEAWLNERNSSLSEEERDTLVPALRVGLPLLSLAASSGLKEGELLDGIASLPGGESSDLMLRRTLSLGEIAQGESLLGSAAPESGMDFFHAESLDNAAGRAGLSTGEKASLEQAMDRTNIPPVDRGEFNRMMGCLLGEYRSIQSSTGMTLFDLTAAADSLVMKRPDAARFSGKPVHFEASLGKLVSEARERPQKMKRVPKEELFRPLERGSISETGGLAKAEAKALTASYLEEQGFGPCVEEVLQLWEEAPVDGALPTAEVLSSRLGEIENPVEMTRAVLSSETGDVSPGTAVALNSRQLSLLKGMYLSHGVNEAQAQKAVETWQGQSFSPDLYKVLRQKVQKRLRASDPVTRVRGIVQGGGVPKGTDGLWKRGELPLPKGSASARIKGEIAALPIPASLRDSVKGVAGSLLKRNDASLSKHTGKGTLRAIEGGVTGRWDKVPRELRGPVHQALRETLGSRMGVPAEGKVSPSSLVEQKDHPLVREMTKEFAEETAQLPVPAVGLPASLMGALSGDWGHVPKSHRPALRRIMREKGSGLNSYLSSFQGISDAKGRSVPLAGQKKQIPLPSLFDGKDLRTYKQMGFRVKPDAGRVESLHRKTRGARLNPLSETFSKGGGPVPKRAAGGGAIPPSLSLMSAAGAGKGGRTVLSFEEEIKKVRASLPSEEPVVSGGTEALSVPILSEPGRPGGVSRPSFGGLPGASPGGSIPKGTPSVSPRSEAADPMDRINRNYEQDKASLEGRMPGSERMLARSEGSGAGGGRKGSEEPGKVRSLSGDLLTELLDRAD